MIRLSTIAALLLTALFSARAQDPLVEALRAYQEGDLAAARTLIDSAVAAPAHDTDAEAWLLRGFVYKDLYKAGGVLPPDTLRARALISLERCLALDSEGTYQENALQAHEYVARSYFNDAARALQAMDEERAIAQFDLFAGAMARHGTDADLKARRIEFLNALGTSYTKRYNQDRERLADFDLAVGTFRQVLTLDPDNYGANYNLATLFYNRGVHNIQELDVENDIPSIQQIQEVSKELFLEALPYMQKAHEMRPDRRETLLGLEGIYYSLQDDDRSEEYRLKFEALPPDQE